MRQIPTKKCLLSTVYMGAYAAWEEGTAVKKDASICPPYNSSNSVHYQSIKMELLRCQDGLCAYTEKRLCPKDLYAEDHWQQGIYKNETANLKEAKGQLDHFDASLKKTKPWLWENLFVVDSEANTKKLQYSVDERLKPDNPDYTPEKWLDYEPDTHHFVPKADLPKYLKDIVREMIDKLGISAMREERRLYLSDKLDDIKMGFKTSEMVQNSIEQFPTAFAFCLQKMNL